MKKIRILSIALIASIVVSFGAGIEVHANVDESLIKKNEKQVDELESQKEKLKEEINDKEMNVEELMLEIEVLKGEKEDIEKELEENGREIIKVEREIDKVQEEIDKLQESIDIRREIIGDRLASYQLNGDIDYLDILFGSQGFIDFISRARTITVIMEADNDIIQNFTNDLEVVEEKMAEVEGMKRELKAIERDNKRKKESLEENIKSTLESKEMLSEQIEELNTSTDEIEKEQDELIEKINKELGMKVGLGSGELEWPTDGGYISSGIGNRTHPVTGVKSKFHKGIDIARTDRSVSPPIYSAEKGVVVEARSAGGYGNMVKVKHEDGMETLYAHLASINVKVGQEVRRGQTIGVMGTTGTSTGIHLHFEVYDNGNLQNPLRYIK